MDNSNGKSTPSLEKKGVSFLDDSARTREDENSGGGKGVGGGGVGRGGGHDESTGECSGI